MPPHLIEILYTLAEGQVDPFCMVIMLRNRTVVFFRGYPYKPHDIKSNHVVSKCHLAYMIYFVLYSKSRFHVSKPVLSSLDTGTKLLRNRRKLTRKSIALSSQSKPS